MSDLTIKFSYRDAPTIREFSESDKFVRGLMGPFGSGKSSGCVWEIIQRAMAQEPGQDGIRRTRWAVIRNTYQQLRDTTIKTFHQWLPPSRFGEWKKAEHTYIIKAFKGCEIEVLFRALDRPDQVDNLLSLELTGAWMNEAREIPFTIFKALRGRVNRYPAKRDGGATWAGLIMDTNPPDNDSWWYKFFEEGKPKNAALFKQPSGLSDEAENLPNLADNYYQDISDGMDSEWIKVYVHGEYGFVIDGKPVYPEYKDSVHCVPCKPIPGIPIYRGWDFGLTPACSFSQVTPRGQWIVFDELVAEDMGIDKFSDDVIVHSNSKYSGYEFVDVGDPAGEARAETDEKTCFSVLKSKGINIKAGKQTLSLRLEVVKKQLRLMDRGEPSFKVDPACKTLRKGFQGGYQFRRMMTAKERYADKPEKDSIYSHVHDTLQYVGTDLFSESLVSKPKYRRRTESSYDSSWII